MLLIVIFFNIHLFHLCSCDICSCVVIWYPFSFLVRQYFSWESFGLNALVVLHIRIQTRRLQGWLVQSYVIFGHHQALRLVIFCSLQYLRRMTPFCNSCACNQSQINVSRILPGLLKLQPMRGGGQRMGTFLLIYSWQIKYLSSKYHWHLCVVSALQYVWKRRCANGGIWLIGSCWSWY